MKDNIILVFGDSIVWGANDSEHGGWAELLKNFAAKKTGYWTAVYPLGISGNTSGDLLNRFVPECEARSRYPINTVIIAIGSGDSAYLKKEDMLRTPPEKFPENIQMLIDLAKGFAKNVVFVGLLPCDDARTTPVSWNPNNYNTNKSAKSNNDIIKDLCKKNSVHFIDLFSEWMKTDYKKLLDDGVHPTTDGHQKIFETVSAFLIKNKLL